jgi:hypothetical protein
MKRYYRLKGEFRGVSLATKKRQSKQTNTRSPVPACTVSNALNTCFIHLFIVQSLPRFPETTELSDHLGHTSEHTHEMDNVPRSAIPQVRRRNPQYPSPLHSRTRHSNHLGLLVNRIKPYGNEALSTLPARRESQRMQDRARCVASLGRLFARALDR